MKIKTVRTRDLSGDIVAKLFAALNPGKVHFDEGEFKLITDSEPSELTYPEGWYYSWGAIHSNSDNSSNTMELYRSDGSQHDEHYNTISKHYFI